MSSGVTKVILKKRLKKRLKKLLLPLKKNYYGYYSVSS